MNGRYSVYTARHDFGGFDLIHRTRDFTCLTFFWLPKLWLSLPRALRCPTFADPLSMLWPHTKRPFGYAGQVRRLSLGECSSQASRRFGLGVPSLPQRCGASLDCLPSIHPSIRPDRHHTNILQVSSWNTCTSDTHRRGERVGFGPLGIRAITGIPASAGRTNQKNRLSESNHSFIRESEYRTFPGFFFSSCSSTGLGLAQVAGKQLCPANCPGLSTWSTIRSNPFRVKHPMPKPVPWSLTFLQSASKHTIIRSIFGTEPINKPL